MTWSVGEDFGWLGSVLFGLPCLLIQTVLLIIYLNQTEQPDFNRQNEYGR